MIEDTQTPQSEANKKDDDFNVINEWQAKDAAEAAAVARQFVDIDTHEGTVKKSFKKGVAATVITAAAVGGAGFAVHEATKAPTFSKTTTEYVVQPGDGLYNAAEDIKGIDSIDIRDAVQHISVDPANIDVLKDGLQPGETIVIPDSVQK